MTDESENGRGKQFRHLGHVIAEVGNDGLVKIKPKKISLSDVDIIVEALLYLVSENAPGRWDNVTSGVLYSLNTWKPVEPREKQSKFVQSLVEVAKGAGTYVEPDKNRGTPAKTT